MSKISGFGNTASAKLLKRGTAKCHPDDKFDPQIGAMIALARMFGDEVEFKSEKEEPERKLTNAEKDALKNGYTLVGDRLPSCTAYDGKYMIKLLGKGYEVRNLYWSHKYKTFAVRDIDNILGTTDVDGREAYKIWMSNRGASPVIAWKPQPDAIEQKALDEGYTLCRDRYPDKSGQYDLITEHGDSWKGISWSSRWQCSGEKDDSIAYNYGGRSAWMTKGNNPAIAWKEHK